MGPCGRSTGCRSPFRNANSSPWSGRRARARRRCCGWSTPSPRRAEGARWARARRRIGCVFQNIGLFPHMTVAENIAITPRLLAWDKGTIAARVDELIGLVRLDPPRHRARLPHQPRGGARRGGGGAPAPAAKPRIVLMDEPFGALDPLTRDALGRDYRGLHDELGLTTVMITHDTLEALLLADRIVVIRDGCVIADGTPHALMREDRDPYVRELLRLPRRQAGRLRDLTIGPPP